MSNSPHTTQVFYSPAVDIQSPANERQSVLDTSERTKDNPSPVLLSNTQILAVEWEPRTMEGVMTLGCNFDKVAVDLYPIVDGGKIYVTHTRFGPHGVFDPETSITLTNVVRDRFYVREVQRAENDFVTLIHLDIRGMVILD